MSENREKKEKVSHKAPGKRTSSAPGGRGPSSGSNFEKYAKFAAVPLIAVILMLIIVISGKLQNKDKEHESDTSDVIALTESVPSDNSVYQSDFSEYELKKNAIPEINSLIQTYFQALSDCDIETVKKIMVLGDSDSFDKKEENMKSEGQYIESYENIDCYTKNGLEDNTYVVYVAYDVKFLQMDTLAPGLARLYVVEDSDGKYCIYAPYSDEVQAYMDEVDKSEDVVLLAREIDDKMTEALASDEKLREFMTILNQGVSGETAASQDSGANGSGADESGADGQTQSTTAAQ